MRCLGLTSERRRCEAEATDTTGYCEAHRDDSALLVSTVSPAPNFGSGLVGLVRRLRGAAVPAIEDEARFEVPDWLKKRSTSEVIQHLLQHPDATVRWAAAFTLRKRRDPVDRKSVV